MHLEMVTVTAAQPAPKVSELSGVHGIDHITGSSPNPLSISVILGEILAYMAATVEFLTEMSGVPVSRMAKSLLPILKGWPLIDTPDLSRVNWEGAGGKCPLPDLARVAL